MGKFISISSRHESAQAVINDCVQQLEALSKESNFGFIYATNEMTADFPELVKQCKSASGIETWVGTIGTGVISTNQEFYDQPAVSIMLANFDKNEFTIVPSISHSDEIPSYLRWPHEFVTNFGIIHGDPFNEETQTLIETLQEKIENGFIVGGLTSSRDKHYQVAEKVVHGGISGVLFSEKVNVMTNLSQGCSPVGEKLTITKSQENTVFTINNKPALELLMNILEIKNYNELQEKAYEVFIGLCIPGSDKTDYTVRNLVGFDPDHSLFAINDFLAEGDEIIFCKRNEETAVNDMQHMLDNLAARLKRETNNSKIKGGIYISCLGRGREQFGDNSEEIKMIHKTLGDFPLTGFFANGEIHHNKLYGYTGVLTLFN